MRVHRRGEAGIDRHDSRNGAAQEGGRLPAAHRHRLHGGALQRRTAQGDSRDRRSARHRRSSGNRVGDRRCQLRCSAPLPRCLIVLACRNRGLPTYIYDADTPRLLATPQHYAYVKIAEGCDYKCAFCIIPTLRGAVSKPAGRVDCARSGITGRARASRNCCSSRRTRRFTASTVSERGALARLLRRLNASPALEWIRLLYLYPTTIDDETLAAMAECEQRLQVHRPAAAARIEPGAEADETPGHAPEIRPAPRPYPRARARASHSGRRSSSGFRAKRSRTSTSSESFVRDHAFDHVGVFTYSHEEGTSAHRA